MMIENKDELLLNSLLSFYKKASNMKIFYTYISKESDISLRVFDFLCTNYTKHNDVIYYIEKKNKRIPFNLNVAYKTQLKAFSKLQFDPFRRHKRIEISCGHSPNGYIITTIGQMNFFKFAIENKLTDWIEEKENFKKIESEISIDSKQNKNHKKPIKKILTSTNDYHITVTFK